MTDDGVSSPGLFVSHKSAKRLQLYIIYNSCHVRNLAPCLDKSNCSLPVIGRLLRKPVANARCRLVCSQCSILIHKLVIQKHNRYRFIPRWCILLLELEVCLLQGAQELDATGTFLISRAIWFVTGRMCAASPAPSHKMAEPREQASTSHVVRGMNSSTVLCLVLGFLCVHGLEYNRKVSFLFAKKAIESLSACLSRQ